MWPGGRESHHHRRATERRGLGLRCLSPWDLAEAVHMHVGQAGEDALLYQAGAVQASRTPFLPFLRVPYKRSIGNTH